MLDFLQQNAAFMAILIPLSGTMIIPLLRQFPNLREMVTLLTTGGLFWHVYQNIYLPLTAGKTIGQDLVDVIPGMTLRLEVEPLGMVYGLIASGLWVVTSVYAIGYVRANKEPHQTRFFTCFALSIAAAMGIAFAGNFFTLFIFYEVLTLATFPLVTHKGTDAAVKAGRTYLGILVGTSVCFLLFAMIWIYSITGNLDFNAAGAFAEHEDFPKGLIGLLYLMAVYGVGKAALMPAHRWLPAAMVAPTPVSALLHAVAVVKAGVFSIAKISVYVFGIDTLASLRECEWLTYMAGFTIILGSIIALYQDNLKKRLAYSTISQLSYIILAVSLFTPIGILAAVLHIAAHAFGKITLFFAAGSIYTATHKTEISQLDGIGRRMPITMGAFSIGSLSMIGIPPTGGFISKWYLLQGAWEREHSFALAVICLSTVLNASYFLPIIYRAFFKAPPEDSIDHGEAPWPIVLSLAVTASLAITLFFYPDVFLALGQRVAAIATGGQG